MTHGGTAKYYTLLLRSEKPDDVPRKASEKEYAKILVEARAQGELPLRYDEDDGFVISGDEGVDGDALLSSDASLDGDDAVGAPEALSSDDGAGSSVEALPAVPVVAPCSASGDSDSSSTSTSESSDSSSESDSDSSSPASEGDVVEDHGDDTDFAKADREVAGYYIRFDKFVSKEPEKKKDYERFVVTCELHDKCRKKRACGARQTAMLGVYEPHSFLVAWAQAGAAFADAKSHVRHKPTRPEIRAAHAEHFVDP